MKPYYQDGKVTIFHGDCLEVMPTLADKSIDMILCDLPYQVTACRWDTLIPFVPLWAEYRRLIKDNGAIVLTGTQPFTSMLIMSNLAWFKYEWIWQKSRPTGFFTAKNMPMKIHENILVFYKKSPTYNPIMTKADEDKIDKRKTLNPTFNPYLGVHKGRVADSGNRYPLTIQTFASISQEGQHPTQKPVALFEYLIRTYTNEGDVVLDNAAGSGTTGVACQKTGRKAIQIEQELQYAEIAAKRLAQSVFDFG